MIPTVLLWSYMLACNLSTWSITFILSYYQVGKMMKWWKSFVWFSNLTRLTDAFFLNLVFLKSFPACAFFVLVVVVWCGSHTNRQPLPAYCWSGVEISPNRIHGIMWQWKLGLLHARHVFQHFKPFPWPSPLFFTLFTYSIIFVYLCIVICIFTYIDKFSIWGMFVACSPNVKGYHTM